MSNPAMPEGRIAQMRQAYRITKQNDRNIGLILLLSFIVGAGVTAIVLRLLLGGGILWTIITVVFALLVGILVALAIFGRRAERAAYAQVEGQAGAAAGALQMMRRGWSTKPAVGFNKNQDVVHRAVGRPGIVLIGEGSSSARVRSLLNAERKKHERIVGADVPVVEVVVGRGDGEVPLPKLTRHLKKLPKAIKPAEQTSVINKLKALDAMRPTAPMPRGPMPTSTKGARRMMRG